MNKTTPFSLTREKHLDHMVKVVPFIVLMFGIQGHILTKIHEDFGGSAIFFLAGCLIFMIGAFITYDIKHQVTFFEDHLMVKFLGISKQVKYEDIVSVFVSESNQTFASIQIRTKTDRQTFFFADDADGIKAFLESHKKNTEFKAAA
jgi:hypothetical protein